MSEEKNIPINWEITSLGNICEKVEKINRNSVNPEDTILYVDISAIDNITNKITSHKEFSWKDAPSRAQQIISKDDILFSTVRTYLRNIAIVDTEIFNDQIASSGFTVIRANKEIAIPKLLYYLTLSQVFLRPLNELQTGTSYPAVRDTDVFTQPSPLPPLPEQHRIVAKIEELFSELDKGIESLKTAQQQLKVYRQAVLKYAFEGKLTNPAVKDGELPEGWEYLSLKDLTVKIVDGTHHTPTYVSSGIHFISVKDINNYKIDFTKTKFISDAEHQLLKNRCNPEKGDILITKSGTIGRLAIVPPSPEFSLFVSVALLKIKREQLQSKFALYALQNHINHLNIENDIKGGLLKNYHLEDLRKATIIYAPFNQQSRIVQAIESRLSICDKLEESIAQSLQQAEALRQSILKKAFEGKLVPQDPNDEPANILLERIRAERAQAQPAKKTRTKKEKA